ncbi:MAG: LPS export ABC transporter periplasmic protein LptC [Candidatus Gastranaerophilales bacterium]|nr:LPS export ABC transporter periplasmic protein LptC [Candidatus Gastranaerophilales bacterium]
MKFLQDILSKFKSLYESSKTHWKKMDTHQRTYFTIAFAIVMVLMWAFITAGVITTNFSRNMLRSGVDRQELQVASMILTETKDGEKFWEIFGETGQYSSDHKVANLNNVVGNFYKDNSVEMSFEASKGIYNEETQEIILYENVFVVLKDDTSLKADRLSYDIRTKELNVEGHVKINRKNSFNAEADKAFIDSNYSRFRISGSTSSKIYK